MGIEDYVDMEVFSNFGFWVIGGGAMLALLAGFKLTKYWGATSGEEVLEIGLITKLLILLGAWIIAYIITVKKDSLPFRR